MTTLKTDRFEFNLKTRIKAGANEALNLGSYLKESGFSKIGIIVDSGAGSSEDVRKILEDTQKNFSQVKVWKYDLKGEPDYDSLDRIKLLFLENNSQPLVDCFVAIGGGSVMDFAKGLALLVKNPGKAIDYRGFPVGIKTPLATITIPTTIGTGSEVTYNAVFINWTDNKKLGINSLLNFPILTILDPILTLSCPKPVIISTVMDSLVHVLESFASPKANVLTKAFAKEAFQLIFDNLEKMLSNFRSLEIRRNLQIGSYLAGVSLMNSSSGPAGALSYPLGVHFKVPHGLGGAIFIPHLIDHNVKKGYDYSQLYDLIEKADKSLSKKDKNRKFVTRIFALCKEAGIPSSLKVFKVNKNNIDLLIRDLEVIKGAFLNNPVNFSMDDGKKMLLGLIKK